MALRFRNTIPYAVPGVLALLGCWWMYSHRKKHASPRCRPAGVAGEEQREEAVPENTSSPATERRPPRRPPLSSEDERPENSTSTFPLPAGSMTPSLLCQSHERRDLSRDLPEPPVTTVQPGAPADDGDELEGVSCRHESRGPACVPSPTVSKSTGAVGSLARDSSPGTKQPLTAARGEPWGAERAADRPLEPPEEVREPAAEASSAASVTLRSGSEKEAGATRASTGREVGAAASDEGAAGSELAGSSEPLGVEPSGEGESPESAARAAAACREEDARPKGDESGREELGGVGLDKEEVAKIEQVAIQIISKVILAATEEVLSASAGDASARGCRAAASRAERPLEAPAGESSDRMLKEEATGGDALAAKSGAAGGTPPQTEGQDRGATDSSCSAHGCSGGPAQGGCWGKNGLCGESSDAGWTPLDNHGGALARLPTVTEDSGCSTSVSEGELSAEEPVRSVALRVASGQPSDSLSLSASPDPPAEQSSVPCERPPTLRLPEDSQVPYSNGILEEDGPDSHHKCSRAEGMEGDRSGGSDVNFVDSGCAMRKTVTLQSSKLGGEPSKSDFIIWEIEVPKELVGRLIGKQGRFMSFLRQASGAKIYVSTLPYFRDSQVCHIEGSTQQVEKVLSLIGKKFKELCLTNVYALPPPTPLTLHSLLMTAWLFLPDGVTVEVVVANQVDAGHMFLQQHTHPTFHVLRSLDQQMFACYSQPEIPTLPTPVEVGIICAAPGLDGAWLRAQVISYFEETNEVELRYVDYGGYDKVKVDTLRQIRSDFLSLPFQGAEVLLDNVVPLPDEERFSAEADAAVSEMTRGAVLVAQVTNYDSATGLPLIQLWNLMGDEVVLINRALVERGFAQWLDY